jgi:hypothetical protein
MAFSIYVKFQWRAGLAPIEVVDITSYLPQPAWVRFIFQLKSCRSLAVKARVELCEEFY